MFRHHLQTVSILSRCILWYTQNMLQLTLQIVPNILRVFLQLIVYIYKIRLIAEFGTQLKHLWFLLI